MRLQAVHADLANRPVKGNLSLRWWACDQV